MTKHPNLDAILDAVGRDKIPEKLNRADLLSDLELNAVMYAINVDFRRLQPLTRNLVRVGRTARKLEILLHCNVVWRAIAQEYPPKAPDLLKTLKKLITANSAALNSAREPSARFAEALRLKDVSPFELLAGRELPKIFREHLGLPVTLRNSAQEPDTPFVRFAQQALIELDVTNKGKPYSRGSIVRAVNDVKRPRRRVR